MPFWKPGRLVLVQVLIFTALIGMLEVGFASDRYVSTTLSVINVLGWGIGMLAWCKADARERGYLLHGKFPLAIVLFGTFTLIYYLFRSRGFGRGLIGVGLFLLFVIAMHFIAAVFMVLVVVLKLLIFHQPLAQPAPAPTPRAA